MTTDTLSKCGGTFRILLDLRKLREFVRRGIRVFLGSV
jgi:hypothetical protein